MWSPPWQSKFPIANPFHQLQSNLVTGWQWRGNSLLISKTQREGEPKFRANPYRSEFHLFFLYLCSKSELQAKDGTVQKQKIHIPPTPNTHTIYFVRWIMKGSPCWQESERALEGFLLILWMNPPKSSPRF